MSVTKITEAAQYLTFRLGDEMFALDVRQVREVLDMRSITKVPRAPDFLKGVINVRGSVVPVADMRYKFAMERTEESSNTRIVVMEISLDGEAIVMGALADSVHNVVELVPEQIEPAPSIGNRWRTEFIRGIGKLDEQFLIILDIDRVFSTDELTKVQATGAWSDAEPEGRDFELAATQSENTEQAVQPEA